MPLIANSHARRREERYHFLVQTKPNNEAFAAQHLEDDDFAVYYPRILKQRAHAGKVDYVPRPLFSSYLFVEDDGRGTFYFRSAPGVSCVVGFGSPVRVGQSIIDRIREREDPNGFIKLDEYVAPADRFEEGEVVRLRGTWQGFNAVFKRRAPEERALVFISLLGRYSKLTVSFSDLEKL